MTFKYKLPGIDKVFTMQPIRVEVIMTKSDITYSITDGSTTVKIPSADIISIDKD